MKVDLIHFGVSSVLLLCLLSDNSAGTCVGIGAREKRRENYIKHNNERNCFTLKNTCVLAPIKHMRENYSTVCVR